MIIDVDTKGGSRGHVKSEEKRVPDFWIDRRADAYCTAEDSEYKIWYCGIIFLDSNDATPLAIARASFKGHIDYNTIHGWFKLVAYSKMGEGWLFFGDNAGSQCLFVDKENALFSDSLLAIRSLRDEDAQPDMEAVSELFNIGRILGEKTIVKGIYRTSPDKFYRYRNGMIETFDKKLADFSALQANVQLDDVLGPTLKAIGDERICAVCTGGTDSRTVLANLAYRRITPDLVITGHHDNPDIPVAKEVATALEACLEIVSTEEKETEWLEKSWIFLDGAYDVVLSYRHLQKAQWAKRQGYAFELGGVGGEFYKNAFCHPIRWGWLKRPSRKSLIKNLFSTYGCQAAWWGDFLRQGAKENWRSVLELIEKGDREKNLLAICNRIGFNILQSGSSAITNGYAMACCKIDPLMDRGLVAAVSHNRPLSLSMHIWQRRQIAAYYPALSEIATDQGYSCSMKATVLFKERCKRLKFYLGRVHTRLQRRLGLKYKGAESNYWDLDYKDARNSQRWRQSLAYCKSIGIVHHEAAEEMIPLKHTGEILLIGMMFSNDFFKTYQKYR